MRVTDAEREAARTLLVEAYADGRLSRAELDARAGSVLGAVTTDDLEAVAADLAVPVAGPVETPSDLGLWGRRGVRDLLVFLVCGLGSVLVWRVAGRGFFWPLWVLVYTGLPLLRVARRSGPVTGH